MPQSWINTKLASLPVFQLVSFQTSPHLKLKIQPVILCEGPAQPQVIVLGLTVGGSGSTWEEPSHNAHTPLLSVILQRKYNVLGFSTVSICQLSHIFSICQCLI